MASIREMATIRVGRQEYASIEEARADVAARALRVMWNRWKQAVNALASAFEGLGRAVTTAVEAITAFYEPLARKSDYVLWPGGQPVNQMRPIPRLAPTRIVPQ